MKLDPLNFTINKEDIKQTLDFTLTGWKILVMFFLLLSVYVLGASMQHNKDKEVIAIYKFRCGEWQGQYYDCQSTWKNYWTRKSTYGNNSTR